MVISLSALVVCSPVCSAGLCVDSLQQWGGFIGPAPAPHRSPSEEKHHLTQQIRTSSAAHRNTHYLHSWPTSLV